MNAEIISIGNELLNGSTVNTNASYIARRLHESGVMVTSEHSLRDRAEEIKGALAPALDRSEVVIVTGGLGPTHDDITKNVMAEFFNSELVYNEDVFRNIQQRFEKRGITMPAVNRGQAMVPQSAELIANPLGTAPGLLFRPENRLVFVLPGVPREMESIMEESVIPFLRKKCPECRVQVDFFRTTGIAESVIYERIRKNMPAFSSYEIAFLPKVTGVDLRIIRLGDDIKDKEKFDKFKNILYTHIGDHLYSVDNRELEAVLGNMLTSRGLTIAVAESVTGGLVQDRLTNVSGSSGYFMGGIVAYSNEAKIGFLKVQAATLEAVGAVSEEVAREMARGVQEAFGTDMGLATTGIAGPTGGTATKPVGLMYAAVAYHSRVEARKFMFGENREVNKQRSAQAAMEMARRFLISLAIVE